MQKDSQEVSVFFRLLYHVLVFFVELLIIVLVIAGVMRLCQASYQMCYEVFGSVTVEKTPGTRVVFEVEEDDTMYQVAGRLAKEGVIANRYSFYIRTELMNPSQLRLRPGKYVLSTSMDYEKIVNELTVSE